MIDFIFGKCTYIMGILNLTPDSFSGDGIYDDVEKAVSYAENMVTDGADIIDVGGESTRPCALPIDLEEEIKRVVPVIKILKNRLDAAISIDTRKAEVAKRALDNGASIINDISGLSADPRMLKVAGQYGSKVVIMHMKGTPQTMQLNPMYGDVVNEIIENLSGLIGIAIENGIKEENIIIDPGIGFGKKIEHNLEILDRLSEFKVLGKPILIGPSRKSFIGNVLGMPPEQRIFGTAASVAIAIKNGANIVRVHDVKEMAQVARLTDTVVHSGEKDGKYGSSEAATLCSRPCSNNKVAVESRTIRLMKNSGEISHA